MTTRRLPIRRVFLVCLLASAVGGLRLASGPTVRAQEPASPKKAAGENQTAAELRRLVKDLESQVEMQRALLEKTEVSLLRAKVLLSTLSKPDDSKLATLREEEEQCSRRLKQIERIVRNVADPSLVRAKDQLRQVRERISELESR